MMKSWGLALDLSLFCKCWRPQTISDYLLWQGGTSTGEVPLLFMFPSLQIHPAELVLLGTEQAAGRINWLLGAWARVAHFEQCQIKLINHLYWARDCLNFLKIHKKRTSDFSGNFTFFFSVIISRPNTILKVRVMIEFIVIEAYKQRNCSFTC